MQLTLHSNEGYQIQGYSKEEIRVNGILYHESLILSPQAIIVPWAVKHANELTATHVQKLIELSPDILIIGTGEKQVFLPSLLLNAFHIAKTPVECMTTPAACRTYNVLASENRHVVAALIVENRGS